MASARAFPCCPKTVRQPAEARASKPPRNATGRRLGRQPRPCAAVRIVEPLRTRLQHLPVCPCSAAWLDLSTSRATATRWLASLLRSVEPSAMVQPPMAQPPTCTCDRANRSALRRLAVYLYHARLMETNRLAPVSRQAARAARGLGHNCGARRCSLPSTLARAAHNLQRGGRAIGKAA